MNDEWGTTQCSSARLRAALCPGVVRLPLFKALRKLPLNLF